MLAQKLDCAKIPAEKREALWEVHRQMTVAAARGHHPIVLGAALGGRPKFFIVGDEPVPHDFITGKPFSGALSEVLSRVVDSLMAKYQCIREQLYITYLVKVHFENLTEKQLTEEWLPAIQLEYALSGCEYVVPIGDGARQLAGHIARTPAYFLEYRPSLKEKLRRCWNVLKA